MAVIFNFIFWFGIFLLVLLYFLFPLYVKLLGVFKRKTPVKSCSVPSASLMILYGHNLEQLRIKIENCLSLESAGERLELVVAVNERDAAVEALVSGYFKKGVKLFYPAERKTAAETMVLCVTECKGEAVIVTDTVSQLDRYAAKNILRKFADEKTGAVSGKAIYTGGHENYRGGLNVIEAYNEYVTRLLDAAGLVVSANMLLYAFRKTAVDGIPAGSSGSSAVPLRAILNGYSSRFEPLAVTELKLHGSAWVLAEEEARELASAIGSASSVKELFGKKKFNSWLCALFDNILLPSSGVAVFLLFILNLLLVPTDIFFIFAFGAQVIFYAAGLTGISKTAYYTALHNFASLKAVYLAWRNKNGV